MLPQSPQNAARPILCGVKRDTMQPTPRTLQVVVNPILLVAELIKVKMKITTNKNQ